MTGIYTAVLTIGLTGGAFGLLFYWDSRLNDPPPGAVLQRHTHLYDLTNPPPTGKLLPAEKAGYRGLYYVGSNYTKPTKPQAIDVDSVSSLPILPVEPDIIIYRRPFSGAVECLIWVMGMGRKYGELQVLGDRFVLARSKFVCKTQNPLLLFSKGETTLPTVKTVVQWREDYPWEFTRWGLL
jgi:hypothetical protein